MDAILTGNIWKQVAAKARNASRRFAAIAYVSSNRHLKFRQGDVLICDASDRAVESGETSARLLQTFYHRGVKLYSRPDLHAKVVVFGDYILLGSCNLSASAEKKLTELALLSNRTQIVAQSKAFVYGLRETSKRIDKDFIRRIRGIKVRPPLPRGPRGPTSTRRFGDRAWLVSVRELPPGAYPREQPFVEKAGEKARELVADKDATISWIRLTGKSRFRSLARPGDTVVQVWRSGKRTTVYTQCPIVYRQTVQHWTRFYVPESKDCPRLSWGRFKRKAKKMGLSRISQNSVRELSPREVLLIEALWR